MAENKDLIKVFLDAGHGSNKDLDGSSGDPGACYKTRKESEDVLKVVLAIGKRLTNEYSNVKVGYSRKKEIYESVSKKAKDSNAFGADYFFSFHRNAFNGKAKGYETLYKTHSAYKDAFMKDIAEEMKALGFVHRGDKQRDNLGVLNQTNAPALLMELGFIDNAGDNKIFDKKFDKIVDAYVRVIAKNCGLKKKPQPKPFALGEYTAMAKALVNAPIRAKRNAASKKLGTLKAGEKIKVIKIYKTATGAKWAKVKHDDGYGFIYLKKLEPCL